MLHLGLAPETCQSCLLGRQGPLASAMMKQGKGMFLSCPNRSHQGRGCLRSVWAGWDHPLLLWFPMHQHVLSQG